MATTLNSATEWIRVQSQATGAVHRVNLTLRFPGVVEHHHLLIHAVLSAWVAVADALVSGQQALDVPTEVLERIVSAPEQVEPQVTVWGSVKLNATYSVSVTVQAGQNPDAALQNAIMHLQTQKHCNQSIIEHAGPEPETEPEPAPKPQPQQNSAPMDVDTPGTPDAPRLLDSTSAAVLHGEVVAFDIARIESAFHNKAQTWQFYPLLSNGFPGRYALYGLTVYRDRLENLPKAVSGFLLEHMPDIGDEIDANCRVLARVNVGKNGRAYFNIVSIEATEAIPETTDYTDIPF